MERDDNLDVELTVKTPDRGQQDSIDNNITPPNIYNDNSFIPDNEVNASYRKLNNKSNFSAARKPQLNTLRQSKLISSSNIDSSIKRSDTINSDFHRKTTFNTLNGALKSPRDPRYEATKDKLVHSSSIPIKEGHSRKKSSDSNDDMQSMYSVSSSITASFSKNFLSGFYKNKIKRRRKGQIVLLSEKYWMKDENCKECFYCARTFHAFRRKHHCRLCGQIFCSSCAFLVPGEKFGYEHKLRFCKICVEHLENDLDSSEDDDYTSFANETIEHDEDDYDNTEVKDNLGIINNASSSMLANDMEQDFISKNTADMASIFGEDDAKLLTESFNPPKLTIAARKTGESLSIETSHMRPRSQSRHFKTPVKDFKTGSLSYTQNTLGSNKDKLTTPTHMSKYNSRATYGSNMAHVALMNQAKHNSMANISFNNSNGNDYIFPNNNDGNKLGDKTTSYVTQLLSPLGNSQMNKSRNSEIKNHSSKHYLSQSQIFPENEVYWQNKNGIMNAAHSANIYNNNFVSNNKSNLSFQSSDQNIPLNKRLITVKSEASLSKMPTLLTDNSQDVKNQQHTNQLKNTYSNVYNDYDNGKNNYVNDIANKRHFSPPVSSAHLHKDNKITQDLGTTQRIYKTLSKTFTPTSSFINRSISFNGTANNLAKYKKSELDLTYKDHNISDIESINGDEEDEASMSIFAALNSKVDGYTPEQQSNKINFDFTNLEDSIMKINENNIGKKQSQNFSFDQNLNSEGLNNPVFRNRQDTDAYKRAEQSLQRMRSRRRSKPKFSFSTVSSSTGGYLSSNIFLQNNNTKLQSTPQLMPSNNVDMNKATTASLQPTKINASGTTSHSLIESSSKSESLTASPTLEEYISNTSETLLFHLRLIVQQTLLDQGIQEELIKKWRFLIEDLVICYDRIKIHTKLSDSLDYRQYIKIKRICGGRIEDSKFVNGLIFSKNLPLRNMPKNIFKPKILLLMFPISYEKAQDKILSVDVLLTQELQYLKSLVSRILALEPDLVFVSDNVSGQALGMLEEAGIACMFNMKPQVIEKISKFCEADVVNSVDKLVVNVKLGICEEFSVKTYRYGNTIKTYTMLTGCNSANGGTVLLRGLDDEGLRKIKNAVEFVTYVILSLRFESCFLKDSFINININDYKNSFSGSEIQHMETAESQFLENFNKRLMSISPCVTFPIPFLLQRTQYLQAKIQRISNLKEDINFYSDEEFESYFNKKPFLLHIKKKGNLSNLDLRYYTQLILDKKLESLQEKFNNKFRQWSIFSSLSDNLLSIGAHQSISLLHSMVSYNTGTPCIGPILISIEYYWDNDVTIGQFVENVVNTVDYSCTSGCGGLFVDHYRTYVHGSAKVDVIVERLPSKVPSLKNIILMWSYCKKCKISTPVLKMDSDTWNLSFGKYMELLFWGNTMHKANIQGCKHDVFKDQIKYFGYNDIVIRLEWSSIEVHSLVTPKQHISWQPQKDILLKLDLLNTIIEQVHLLYGSIVTRLKRVKLDSSIESLNIEGRAKSIELQQSSINEKEIFLKYANEVYMNTPGTDHLSLNAVVSRLYGKSLTWMKTVTDFEKKYLPSERDIARITSNQLKKLFMDDADTQNDSKMDTLKEVEENGSDNAVEMTPDPHTSLEPLFSAQNNLTPDKSYSHLYKVKSNLSETDSISRSHTPDKLSVHESTDNNILSKHLRTMSQSNGNKNKQFFLKNINDGKQDISDVQKNGDNANSENKEESADGKVGKLANYFNNMYFDNLSREFEHQREQEKADFQKKYQYSNKPTKIQDSKPKVEVFQNVEDAVAENITYSSNLNDRLGSTSMNREDSVKTSNNVYSINSGDSNADLETSLEAWENGEEVRAEQLARHLDENNPRISIIKETDDSENNDEVNNKKQQEKGSLLQLLKNFWADRSSALWEPIHLPLLANEHIFDNNLVIIREDEPSSIISFCLNSKEYFKKMEQTYLDYSTNIGLDTSDIENEVMKFENKEVVTEKGEDEDENKDENVQSNPEYIKKLMENPALIEAMMNKPTPIHLRYQVEDENVVMACKIFFADQFDALRRAYNIINPLEFIQSLSRCVKWDSSGGKSGSVFLKTSDDRFVLKELSHSEIDAFVQFAPNYFKYMSESIYQKLPTAIAKIVGFFQIQLRNNDTGKTVKFDCIITENLFYGKNNVRIFDLKGSMRNRHVQQTGKENEVLLDENMVEYIYESPIFVREYDKKLLRASVWNDTLFLSKMNVMDYSLVIGIDNNNHKLIVGIIDCIRTFTWDKKLESWVKEKGLVGGGTKEPTVVTPKQYKNRFREAMERYILMVPDPWSKSEHSK
ncbi:1-phosphatidylinositol-3-phosphate 5-kinase [Hanseniaspora uvarum]|nr:1-phosphatidylinositol-3-phosphate 5-kinase [Hanseniaspora uvarum]